MLNDPWNYIEDGVFPIQGQHVIVWDLRDNVRQGNGDNADGQVQGGDCFYSDELTSWHTRPISDRERWNNSFSEYIECGNGPRHGWSGQGPCKFSHVVAWRPFPTIPARVAMSKLLEAGNATKRY